MAIQLSIIVPVYKEEKYIRSCIESIYRQGMDETCFEVIIVNDGTPDRSTEMIADIIEFHQNIRIINQKNQGVSIARNHGIEVARGEYILFFDSDDILIDNSLTYLLDQALSSKADLVVADFISMNDEQIAQFKNNPFKQKDGKIQEKSGKKLLLQDLNPHICYVWNTLYRRAFLDNYHIRFIPGILYEDVLYTHQCYLNANRCIKMNWQFIIYRKEHESITNSFNLKKAFDYGIIISKLWELSRDKNLCEPVRQKIRNDAFVSFSMLFYVLTTKKDISRSDKMSVLNTMKKNIPDLAFKNGLKQNIVNFLYHKMPNTYMTLRIFYANHLQYICWTIGDFIRNKKN